MTAYGRHMSSLMDEIDAYLAFFSIAREDDHLWREYKAWCALVDKIAAYSMYR